MELGRPPAAAASAVDARLLWLLDCVVFWDRGGCGGC